MDYVNTLLIRLARQKYGRVPANKLLFRGRVPANNLFQIGE